MLFIPVDPYSFPEFKFSPICVVLVAAEAGRGPGRGWHCCLCEGAEVWASSAASSPWLGPGMALQCFTHCSFHRASLWLNISKPHPHCKEPQWPLSTWVFLVPKHKRSWSAALSRRDLLPNPAQERFLFVFMSSSLRPTPVWAFLLGPSPALLHRCCTAATCWGTARDRPGHGTALSGHSPGDTATARGCGGV